jgi:hypothetical protein
MSDTPIHDALSADFDVSKKWWKAQGAIEEVEILLAYLKAISKPTKQITVTIEVLEDRLKELGKRR